MGFNIPPVHLDAHDVSAHLVKRGEQAAMQSFKKTVDSIKTILAGNKLEAVMRGLENASTNDSIFYIMALFVKGDKSGVITLGEEDQKNYISALNGDVSSQFTFIKNLQSTNSVKIELSDFQAEQISSHHVSNFIRENISDIIQALSLVEAVNGLDNTYEATTFFSNYKWSMVKTIITFDPGNKAGEEKINIRFEIQNQFFDTDDAKNDNNPKDEA